MQGSTHKLGGLVAGAMSLYAATSHQLLFDLPVVTIPFYVAGTLFGSLLPDIDHSSSTLGRKIKPLSNHLKHRGGTHSLLFAVGVPVGMGALSLLSSDAIISQVIRSFAGGTFMGVISHLALDLLNPTGVPLLWPVQKKFRLAKIRTGGSGEKLVAVFLVAVLVALLWGIYGSLA